MNKKVLLFFAFFIQLSFIFSQETPLEMRGSKIELQGNITFAGNTIVTTDEPNFNDEINNEECQIKYLREQFEGMPTPSSAVFSSSGYNLKLPDCSTVKYARLYWGGVWDSSVNQVWFKTPSINNATPITKNGQYFDSRNKMFGSDNPYICYADVTQWVRESGEYYVANIKTRTSNDPRANDPKGIGFFGGWVLVVIYENKEETNKKFYIYDGLLAINGDKEVTYSGLDAVTKDGETGISFLTCAFDGDPSEELDSYDIKLKNDTFEHIINYDSEERVEKDDVNQVNDFFNSSISRYGKEETSNTIPTNREGNYLGIDIDLVELNNQNTRIFGRNDTSIDVQFKKEGRLIDSNNPNNPNNIEQDFYFPFLNVIMMEAPRPNIQIITTVDDGNVGTNNKNNTTLGKGGDMWYDIAFINKGYKDAINTEIKIELDPNLEVVKKSNGTNDIEFKKGNSHQDFKETPSIVGNTCTFKIKNAHVGAKSESIRHIRIHVKLKEEAIKDCDNLQPSCNVPTINSKVSATYKEKDENGNIVGNYQYPSNRNASVCKPISVKIRQVECRPKSASLCDSGTATLTVENNNFRVYEWTKEDDTNFNRQGREITVSQAGTYIVKMRLNTGCEAVYKQTFNVTNFAEIPNPLEDFTSKKTCPIGSGNEEVFVFDLPCSTDSKTLETTVGDTVAWYKLNTFNDCPSIFDINNHPNWTEISTNNTQEFNNKGNYCLYLKKDECDKVFYFNINKEEINPVITPQHITCTQKGKIEVTGVPAGYKYAFQKIPSTEELNYQDKNFIEVAEGGKYGIYIKKEGTDCEHSETVIINKTIEVVSVNVTDKKDQKCPNGTPPEFTIKVDGGTKPYTFKLNGQVTSTPSSVNGEYTFKNLTAGQIYKVTVEDSEGCSAELENIRMEDVQDTEFSLELGRKYCEEVELKLIETRYNPNAKFYWYSEDNPTAKTPFDNSGVVRISSKGQDEKTYWVVAEILDCQPKKVSIKVPLSNNKPTFEVDKSVKNRFIIKPSKGNPPYTILVDGTEIIEGNEAPITETKYYTITVIDDLGCESHKKVFGTYYTFGVPNFFTPDGDGKNDSWGAYEVEDYNELEIFIYDRYGRELAHLKGRETWDGTYQGKKLPRGDYWYTMYYKEGTQNKKKSIGHFTLYRK